MAPKFIIYAILDFSILYTKKKTTGKYRFHSISVKLLYNVLKTLFKCIKAFVINSFVVM